MSNKDSISGFVGLSFDGPRKRGRPLGSKNRPKEERDGNVASFDTLSGVTRRPVGRPRADHDSLGGSVLTSSDGRKQSLYFQEGVTEQMKEEAVRLDRSLSWVVQRAWAIAKDRIAAMPAADDTGESDHDSL